MAGALVLTYKDFRTDVAALLLERTEKVLSFTWTSASLVDASKDGQAFCVEFHHEQTLDEQLAFFLRDDLFSPVMFAKPLQLA